MITSKLANNKRVPKDLDIITFRNELFGSNLMIPDNLAVSLYSYQLQHLPLLNEYYRLTGATVPPQSLAELRFLPIQFFKTQQVLVKGKQAEIIFKSSATTSNVPSSHYVADLSIYRDSFQSGFIQAYGHPSEYAILALLPSYLERSGSSLVLMADELIKSSTHPNSGFFLNDFNKLSQTLNLLKTQHQKTILLGVTYALLDFVDNFPMQFPELIVMETGGMKGRKQELTRAEVHHELQKGFGVKQIHAEYGMTELLSQAYAKGQGRFQCPPWMKVLISDPTDPFTFLKKGKRGVINIIDLANMYSCAFIQTEDTGLVHEDGTFEVTGRLDQSEIRGCSLMYS